MLTTVSFAVSAEVLAFLFGHLQSLPYLVDGQMHGLKNLAPSSSSLQVPSISDFPCFIFEKRAIDLAPTNPQRGLRRKSYSSR